MLTLEPRQREPTIGPKSHRTLAEDPLPLQRNRRGRTEMKRATGTGKYEQLLERCRSLAPVPTAVAHPCEASALTAAVEAGRKNLIKPILVGPAAKIAEVAKAAGLDLSGVEIVDAPHSHGAAEKAVALIREGRAEVL